MEKFLLLLLFCHVSSAERHSLKFFFTASSGIPNFPELVVAAMIDETLVGYCDTNRSIVEPKQDWVKKLFDASFHVLEWCSKQCFEHMPILFKVMTDSLMKLFSQSGGVHIVQDVTGCEWDDETGEVTGLLQIAYDGEDFLSFDQRTSTWIALKPQAVVGTDAKKNERAKLFITQECPAWLKNIVAYSSLPRTELPLVSLLQKTPSSSVSCHASGFYPDRAALFWRKDGEEIHEDVEHGEIIPNHNGTFQMSVDLNISSITPADWRRYECVFQLSGVKDDIVTKLDKAVIRTNEVKPSDVTIPIIIAVVVFALILIAATGFIVYRRKKANLPPSSPGITAELDLDTTEKLNPEA